MNILISSAGRRVSLIIFFKKELKKLKSDSKVITTDLDPDMSPACRVSDLSFKVRNINEEGSIEELINICKKNYISIIIPTIDTELLILSKNQSKFKLNGIDIILSNPHIIKLCRNKRLTNRFFDELKIPRCKEYHFNKLKYPLFIKPIDGSMSRGLKKITKKSELNSSELNNKNNLFLEYIDNNDFDEYTIDMYFNKNSKLICFVPRRRIEIRAGEVSKSITDKNILFIKDYFNDNNIGFKGCINLQIFKNKKTNNIIGIEINPRFGGGYPLSYYAGANYPKMIIKEYLFKEEINDYYENWHENTLMLRYDKEIIISC